MLQRVRPEATPTWYVTNPISIVVSMASDQSIISASLWGGGGMGTGVAVGGGGVSDGVAVGLGVGDGEGVAVRGSSGKGMSKRNGMELVAGSLMARISSVPGLETMNVVRAMPSDVSTGGEKLSSPESWNTNCTGVPSGTGFPL